MWVPPRLFRPTPRAHIHAGKFTPKNSHVRHKRHLKKIDKRTPTTTSSSSINNTTTTTKSKEDGRREVLKVLELQQTSGTVCLLFLSLKFECDNFFDLFFLYMEEFVGSADQVRQGMDQIFCGVFFFFFYCLFS